MTSAFNKRYTGTRSAKNPNRLWNLAGPASDPAGACGRLISRTPTYKLLPPKLLLKGSQDRKQSRTRLGEEQARSAPGRPDTGTQPPLGESRGSPAHQTNRPGLPREGAPDAPAGRPCQRRSPHGTAAPRRAPPHPKRGGGVSSLSLTPVPQSCLYAGPP